MSNNPQINRYQQAILEAKAEMNLVGLELSELAETEHSKLQRHLTECFQELIKHPDELPDPRLLLQRIKKIKQDCSTMYNFLELIYNEVLTSNTNSISLTTQQRLAHLLGKTREG